MEAVGCFIRPLPLCKIERVTLYAWCHWRVYWHYQLGEFTFALIVAIILVYIAHVCGAIRSIRMQVFVFTQVTFKITSSLGSSIE